MTGVGRRRRRLVRGRRLEAGADGGGAGKDAGRGEREPDNPPQPLPGGSSLGPHDEEPPPPRERTGREGATLAVGMEERRKIPET
jgi:hypothetical protein